jgi:hypothetical protein
LDQKEFDREMKRFGASPIPMLASPQANATAHHITTSDGRECTIVALGSGHEKYSLLQVLALLTHEAVHIWQFYCESIGERYPGKEQEAYAVQTISQNLWDAYTDMTGRKKL